VWKQASFEGYQSRQSALDRPLAIIRRGEPHRGTANKRVFVGYGQVGFSQYKRKGSKSVPITSLLAAFRKCFGSSSIAMVDEFHSTRCCAGCGKDLPKVHTNRWSQFKIDKYNKQLAAFHQGKRAFPPYLLHDTHRIEGLVYCESETSECIFGRTFIDRDVIACHSIQNGFLCWLRCEPPPSHMSRGGSRKNIPLPQPVSITYEEEKHWYSERRLPNPYAPNPEATNAEEAAEEEFEQEQDRGRDMEEEPIVEVVELVIPPAAMEVDPALPTVPIPIRIPSINTVVLATKLDALKAAVTTSSALLGNKIDELTTGLTSKLDTLNTSMASIATGINIISANISKPTSSLTSTMTNKQQDVLDMVDEVTTTATSSGSVVTVQVTIGGITTTTVTPSAPTSSSTTTTTTRRKSAAILPVNVSSIGDGTSQQAIDPSLKTHHLSAGSTAASTSILNGGPALMAPQANVQSGNIQRQVQEEKRTEETLESNQGKQGTQTSSGTSQSSTTSATVPIPPPPPPPPSSSSSTS
jgi:hypothetical protein